MSSVCYGLYLLCLAFVMSIVCYVWCLLFPLFVQFQYLLCVAFVMSSSVMSGVLICEVVCYVQCILFVMCSICLSRDFCHTKTIYSQRKSNYKPTIDSTCCDSHTKYFLPISSTIFFGHSIISEVKGHLYKFVDNPLKYMY